MSDESTTPETPPVANVEQPPAVEPTFTPAPVGPLTAQHNKEVEMNSGKLFNDSKMIIKSKATDGRYYPTKYAEHPCLTEGFEESLSSGDAIYCAHAFNKYFVISKEQSDAGMVLRSIRFPEPANLIEIIP